MVRTVAAAAGGQARVFTGSERGPEWAKAEEQNQQNGKRAPHLALEQSGNHGWPSGMIGLFRFLSTQTREFRCLK
jgi:hypothetical protein